MKGTGNKPLWGQKALPPQDHLGDAGSAQGRSGGGNWQETERNCKNRSPARKFKFRDKKPDSRGIGGGNRYLGGQGGKDYAQLTMRVVNWYLPEFETNKEPYLKPGGDCNNFRMQRLAFRRRGKSTAKQQQEKPPNPQREKKKKRFQSKTSTLTNEEKNRGGGGSKKIKKSKTCRWVSGKGI